MPLTSWQSIDSKTLIGVALCCAGNVLISVALNVQKLVHQRIDETKDSSENETQRLLTHDHLKRTNLYDGNQNGLYPQESPENSKDGEESSNTNYLKKPLWWLGLLLMAAGEMGNFASYSFAPASVVAPLGTVALITNCFIAPLLLKEPFKKADLIGIALSIVGAVTVVISSQQSSGQLSPKELLKAITGLPFIIYSCITVPAFCVLIWLSRTTYGDQYVLIDVGACALAGGYTVLATKAVSSLISAIWFRIFRYPVIYAVLAVLIATAIIQIQYLNKALQRFDSQEVIPTNFVCFTISAIVGSSVLYRDFEHTTFQQALNFIFGCGLVFGGVRLLTKSRSSSSENKNDSSSEPSTQRIRINRPDVSAPDDNRQGSTRAFPIVVRRTSRLTQFIPTSPRKASMSAGYLLVVDQQDRAASLRSVNLTPIPAHEEHDV